MAKKKEIETKNKLVAKGEFFDSTTMQRFAKGKEVPLKVAERAQAYVAEVKEEEE